MWLVFELVETIIRTSMAYNIDIAQPILNTQRKSKSLQKESTKSRLIAETALSSPTEVFNPKKFVFKKNNNRILGNTKYEIKHLFQITESKNYIKILALERTAASCAGAY